MKSWVKSGARQVSSGRRTFAALVLGPVLALTGCAEKDESVNTPPPAAQKIGVSALSSNLIKPYEKAQVPIEWRTFTGTNLNQGDDTVSTVTSPFPIKFANGAGSTSVRVSMNGAIVLSTASIDWTNTNLPSAAHTTMIAPFWDDLFPGSTGNNVYWGVIGDAPARELVFEWRDVLHRDRQTTPLNTLRFQVVFFEDSPDILFNYKDVIVGNAGQDKGASATVGVQNSASEAIVHSFNTASLENDTAYLWTFVEPSTPPVVGAITTTPIELTEGDTLTVETSFTDADGPASGPWKVQVDTGYVDSGPFTTDFSTSVTAEGPATVTGQVRTSGNVTVGVRVMDKGNIASTVATAALTVADVPPTIDPVTISGEPTERLPVTLTTAFTDPGLDSPWKVQWDFDYDGSDFTVDHETIATAAGNISLSHGFDHDGTFTVGVRISDKDGVTSNIETLNVTVADLTPSLTGIAGTTELYEGGTLDLSAIFTDPGDHSKPWRIQWDFDYDGTNFDVEEEEETNTAGEIRLTRYARDSGQTIYALRVVDDDGSITEVRELPMNIIEANPILSPISTRFLSGDGSEPSAVAFELSALSGAEDANADPLGHFQWDFDGDGVFEYASTMPFAMYNYRDNPAPGTSYTARVRVTDEDGFSEEEITVSITNVAPTLTAPATASATANSLLALRVSATDPGADAITYSIADAPAGVSFTADGLLLWTPTIRQGSGQGRQYTVTVTATDDDGGTDSAQIAITVGWRDLDNDGIEDGWEAENGLDPSVNDANGDLNGDGVTNLAEFLSENGGPRIPEAAVANGPLSGDKVDDTEIVLSTKNVTNAGDLSPVRYQFQVFSDAALTTKVRDETVDQSDSEATTSVTITDGTTTDDVDLVDDHVYAWRVRATDGTITGPWSTVQHVTFNPTNDAPGAPATAQPISGSLVSASRPVLVADNALDVDDSSLSYVFEVAENAAFSGTRITSPEIAGGAKGSTSWQVSSELKAGTTYHWRVTAKDEHGATTTSEASSFSVYLGGSPSNREPGVPVLAEPTSNGTVTSLTPELVADVATDADGDALTYTIEVDTSAAFTSASRQASPALQAGDDGKVRWTTGALTENQTYFWRARARDSLSASDWNVGSFIVNAANDAPSAPVALNPSDAVIYTKKPTLSVLNGKDPEGDAVTYSFEVKKADGSVATSGDAAAGANGTTSFTLTKELEEGVEYIWVARGKDTAGAVSAASAEARFQVYKAPEIPDDGDDDDDGGCSAGAGSLGGLLPLLAMALGVFRRRRS